MGYGLGLNNSFYNRYGNGFGNGYDFSSDLMQIPQPTVFPTSFTGSTSQESEKQPEKKDKSNDKTLLAIIGAGAAILLAGATHKTINFSKVIKEAGLEKECKISKARIFLRNTLFSNWFEGSASKTLAERYTKVGDSNKLFKSASGDTLFVDCDKIFAVKSGKSIELENLAREGFEAPTKYYPSSTSYTRSSKSSAGSKSGGGSSRSSASYSAPASSPSRAPERTPHVPASEASAPSVSRTPERTPHVPATEATVPKEAPKVHPTETGDLSKIADYPSPKSLSAIAALKGTAEENVGNIKRIFMEEMGYNHELINAQVKELPAAGLFSPEEMVGGLNYYTGEFMLNQEMLEVATKEQLAGLMRHELDHFDKAVKICKSIGVDEYERLFAGLDMRNLDGAKETFNRQFWEKATQGVDTTGFDTAKYLEGLKTQLRGGADREIGAYGDYLRKVQYVTNPLEVSAHNIEHSVQKGLNATAQVQTYEHIPPLFNSIDSEFDALISSNPTLRGSKSTLFDYFYNKAAIESDSRSSALFRKITSTATPDPKDVSEFQEIVRKKLTALRGSKFTPPDTVLEKQVLETMATQAKKGLSQNEIAEAFVARQQQLKMGLGNIFNSGQTDAIKKALAQNSDRYLAHLEANKMGDANIVLDILLTKIHCENKISSAFAPNMARVTIPADVKTRIFSNEAFKEMATINNMDNETLLTALLQQTAFSPF